MNIRKKLNVSYYCGAIALLWTASAFAQQFRGPVNYFLGRTPSGVADGDFNHDGNVDLAVTGCGNPDCTTTGSVLVLLGEGNGQFSKGAVFVAGPPGTNADTLATGDFNRDGAQDLVVVNNAINQFGTISILLCDGQGGFLPPVSYSPGGAVPVWAAVADFNNDSYLDLAISVTTTDSVAVFLGNGDGTFRTAINYPVGSAPQGISTGDVNNDGLQDIVSADECGDDPACRAGTVSVLLGNGDGSFQPRLVFPEGMFPLSIEVADFNRDNNPDLAIANPCGTDPACVSTGSVGIMLGNGDGTFQPVTNYPATGYDTARLAVGKFNRDGPADLVALNYQGSDITVFIANGDGTLQPGTDYLVGLTPNGVTVGNFDHSLGQDLAVTDQNSFEVSVLVSARNGQLH